MGVAPFFRLDKAFVYLDPQQCRPEIRESWKSFIPRVENKGMSILAQKPDACKPRIDSQPPQHTRRSQRCSIDLR